MSRHWATIGEAGALSGLRFMVWINAHLGRTVFNIVLIPVMAYFLLRRPIARRASGDYLRRVKQQYPDQLPERVTLWLSFRHFLAYGQSLLDSVVAWTQPLSAFHMEPDELEMRASLVRSRTGIVMIGSHFGNMEYSRSIAKSHKNLVVNILLYDQHAANFAAMLRRSAPESRLNLIQVTDLDIELAFRLKEKVEQGEWVVIAGDRVPVGNSANVCPATFFGAPANFPIGPYVLAKVLSCPVYLLHCFRMQGQYHLGMELFEEKIQLSRRGQRRSYDQYVQKFATLLERQVRREPLQWFNFYDFWGDRNTSQPQTDRLRDDDQE
ncbi:MAG: acyltransferase [Gammaproteobacteria bacterium]|nr:acyltransferase [Gammaproteobacteria bacterium]MDH3749060.1 acyltransferase [Gammaproteobacteria bacterium]MDH3805975.1 acyltransferase [Gammaproteobacteria bacterium]